MLLAAFLSMAIQQQGTMPPCFPLTCTMIPTVPPPWGLDRFIGMTVADLVVRLQRPGLRLDKGWDSITGRSATVDLYGSKCIVEFEARYDEPMPFKPDDLDKAVVDNVMMFNAARDDGLTFEDQKPCLASLGLLEPDHGP